MFGGSQDGGGTWGHFSPWPVDLGSPPLYMIAMREETVIVSLVAVSFICGIFASFLIFPQAPVQKMEKNEAQKKGVNATVEGVGPAPVELKGGVKAHLVGVGESGKGKVAPLWVRASPGEGRTLVNIKNLFFWIDTQYSIRLASEISRDRHPEGGEYDLMYSVGTNSSIVGGPSAGAALTVATLAAIQNKTLNEGVIMTGTIEKGGDIGEVGGILAKAKAAERKGFDVFLIPEGQMIQVRYVPREYCRNIGNFRYCTTEYKKQKTDVQEEVGIDVVEVENIDEAFEHFVDS